MRRCCAPRRRVAPGRGGRRRAGGGNGADGGITRYPSDALYEEVAYIAYHFHWPREDVLSMEHADRRRWVEEIARINRRLGGS